MTLLLTNALTLTAFVSLALYDRVPARILAYITPEPEDYSFTDNFRYAAQQSHYEVYQPENVNIVMFGDSITHAADWHELLNRTDIVNRSIVGDITEGFVHRLDSVTSLEPQLCFIMAGINDLWRGKGVEHVVDNYQIMIDRLLQADIIPIIQSTLYVAKTRPDYLMINQQVEQLNTELEQLASSRNLIFLNLNDVLAEDNMLIETYTYDGLHLLGNAYVKWQEELLPILERYDNL